MMDLNALLLPVLTEIAAAERRTAELAKSVCDLLSAGEVNANVERSRVGGVDRLSLLRKREWAMREMLRLPEAA